jgi:hypothetical protein
MGMRMLGIRKLARMAQEHEAFSWDTVQSVEMTNLE